MLSPAAGHLSNVLSRALLLRLWKRIWIVQCINSASGLTDESSSIPRGDGSVPPERGGIGVRSEAGQSPGCDSGPVGGAGRGITLTADAPHADATFDRLVQ